MKLTVFDLINQVNGLVSINNEGDIRPKIITGNRIIYFKENSGLIRELEVTLSDIK